MASRNFDTICLHCGFRFGAHYGGYPDWECPVLRDPLVKAKGTKRADPHGSAGHFVETVEVDQVWRNGTTGQRWYITSIRDGSAYGNPADSFDTDLHFGVLGGDQRPYNWNKEWYCESVKGQTVPKAVIKAAPIPAPKDDRQAELEFFRATQPGQCACGIPRQQCDYHR